MRPLPRLPRDGRPFLRRRSRRRRILHLAWGHPPEFLWCGPVKYLHTLALAQQAAGDDVTVVAASDRRRLPGERPHAPDRFEFEGILYLLLCNGRDRIVDLWDPRREIADPDLDRVLRSALADAAPDVVHIHNFAGLSFEVVDAARAGGAAALASLHNYTPICSRDDLFFADAERCGGPLERSCSRCLGSMAGDDMYLARLRAGVEALNRCDRLLAVSTRVAEIYRRQGVSAERMAVERIGSQTAEELWLSSGRDRVARARRNQGPASDGRPLRAVFFGTMIPRKGVRVVLQALARMHRPDSVELHLHGGYGPDEERTVGWFRENHSRLQRRIHVHGAYAHGDLRAVLAAADVAILPPRWEDNGPQTVFEALGAGVPVVASDVGGIPDVVEHGTNGILFPEGDSGALAGILDALGADRSRLRRLTAGIRSPRTIEQHRVALAEHYADALAARTVGSGVAG